MLYLPYVVLLYTYFLAVKVNGSAFLRFLRTLFFNAYLSWQFTEIVCMFKCEPSQCISVKHYLQPCLVKIPCYKCFLVHRYHCKNYVHCYIVTFYCCHHDRIIMVTFVGFKYIFIVCSILTLFCNALSG